jgi:hypothetical protein
MYGTIEKTMEILQIKKKGHLLNALERFHIYNLSNKKLQMKDTFTYLHKPIFDLLINNPQYNIIQKTPPPSHSSTLTCNPTLDPPSTNPYHNSNQSTLNQAMMHTTPIQTEHTHILRS